jgi:hypothetical protein
MSLPALIAEAHALLTNADGSTSATLDLTPSNVFALLCLVSLPGGARIGDGSASIQEGRLEIDAQVAAAADPLAQDTATMQATLANKAEGGIVVQSVCVTSRGALLKEAQEALERINELLARQINKMIDPTWHVVDVRIGSRTVKITFSRG